MGKVLNSSLSIIWENTHGCADQYRCNLALYIVSVIYQCYSVIIDRGISAYGHGKELFYGINDIDKRYIYQLMYNVQLTGSKKFDSHIIIHSSTQKNDVSMEK